MDRDLIEREEAEAEEEGNKKKGDEQEKGEENTSSLSPWTLVKFLQSFPSL